MITDIITRMLSPATAHSLNMYKNYPISFSFHLCFVVTS